MKKGAGHNERTKLLISEGIKRAYAEGRVAKRKPLSVLHKEHIRQAMLGRKILWADKISEAHKGKLASPEARAKMSHRMLQYFLEHPEAMKGENNPQFGRRFSEEHRQRISEALKGIVRSPEFRAKISAKNKNRRLSPKTMFKNGHISLPEWKLANSEALKGKWQDEEYVRKQMRARGVHPNKKERQIEELANQYGLPLHFVGDGQLIIGGKCPDFHNGNGKVVELFGDYWHRNDNPSAKIEFYEKFGYKCLVIWENELSDVPCVISKLKEFLQDGI